MKTIGVIVIALAMLVALAGVVTADRITSTYSSPGHYSVIQAGSTYDLTIGSVVTSTDNRFVGTDVTAPVALNYAISVKPYTIQGQGTFPAMGTVSAYVKAHIQEGQNSNGTDMNEDLTYAESSSASGIINSFSKVIAFQSGKAVF